MEGLLRDLVRLQWDDIYLLPDIDDKLVLLNHLVNILFEGHVPLKTLQRNQNQFTQ